MSNFKVNWSPVALKEPETESEIKRALEVQRELVRKNANEIKLLQEQIKRHKGKIRELEVKLRKLKKE